MGTELFHSDGQTDFTNFVVAFHNFANAPQECCPFGPCTVHHPRSLYKCCAKANVIYSRSMKRLNDFLAGLREFEEN